MLTVKLTKSWSIYPQDTGLEPVVNPPYWASETAISLNLTIPPAGPASGRSPGTTRQVRDMARNIRSRYHVGAPGARA